MKSYYWDEILHLAYEYPDIQSLQIRFPIIERFDMDLSKELLNNPVKVIEELETALKEIDLPIEKTFEKVFIRIIDIPSKVRIGELRSKHLSKLISVEGMIRKATEVRPRITKAAFQCLRCEHITVVEQTGYKYEEPFAGCENDTCGKRGPFKILIEESTFVDAQKLQIQEPPEDLKGTQAQSLDIDIDNDLTGKLFPGERVIINGILKSRQRILKDGKSTFYDIILEANSIERMGTAFDELEMSQADKEIILSIARDPKVYEKTVSSIAPLIKGMEDVKQAMVLQLFSGVPKTTPDGSFLRGDIHILLLGDPSKGKTKLMKSSQARSPRAVFTSGKATTAGGLTAIAVKDEKFGDGRWVLEGGALVIADRGVAYIDEADKMKSTDRDALHEAMEQQEINLAKAGIIATLKTRTAVFMSANPKYGQFDKYEELAEQINMPPSLLSRFDLIFILLDEPNPINDAQISEHILQTHVAGEMKQLREVSTELISSKKAELAAQHIIPEIPSELFRKYVAYARKNIFPVLTEQAIGHIHNLYLSLRAARSSSKTKSIPITTRQEEAMVRLAEASARVRLSQEVTLEDAERATGLMMTCLKTVGYDPKTGETDSSFLNSVVSKDQRSAIKTLKDIMKTRSIKHSNGIILVSEILNEAEIQGVERERAEKSLIKMVTNGDVFKPDKEHVKLLVKT